MGFTTLLFAPALTWVTLDSPEPMALHASQERIAEAGNAHEMGGSRDFGGIYSILQLHCPDGPQSEIRRLAEVIHEETAKRQLDPLMVLALIRIESGFEPKAVSPAGARGMMQIMPETGRKLVSFFGREYGFSAARFTDESLDDPVLNVRLGIHYLHGLKQQFHDWSATLTAYNFGPGDTRSRIENKMELSEDFAILVMNVYERYKRDRHPSF